MSSETPELGNSSKPAGYLCQRCGAALDQPTEFCWLCFNLVREKEPKQIALREKAEPTRLTFSLSTLMLAMTLIAVLSGLYTIAPDFWFGTTLIVLATSGLIRAARVVKLETETKGPMTEEEKFYAVIASLGRMFLLGLLAFTMWYMAFGWFYSNPALGRGPIADSMPLVAALCVFVVGLLMTWPRRR